VEGGDIPPQSESSSESSSAAALAAFGAGAFFAPPLAAGAAGGGSPVRKRALLHVERDLYLAGKEAYLAFKKDVKRGVN
jgi:hypothetical protein